MAKPVDPDATATANYQFMKPAVGASDDVWGGDTNYNWDQVDAVVHGIDTRPPGGAIVSATPPGSPTPGMLWFDSVGGQSYVWYDDGNTQQWVVAVNAVASLSPATTTTLGGVKVDGTSIKAAGDGTISTVLVPMGDNRIINGDMRIDQRNNGASGTAAGYTVDRWAFYGAVASKISWGQNVGAAPGAPSFPYCLGGYNASGATYTPAANEYFNLYQSVEADMISDFGWGAAGAQPVTLSFWAYTNHLIGMFSGSIRNYAGTRSYPFTFSLPVTGTWTRIVVNIPGDTAGTWVMNGNVGGLIVNFVLSGGTSFMGPAGAWASANYVGATGSLSLLSTSSNNGLWLTGVKLEIGSVATPYNRQSLAKSMADCQRYYQVGQAISANYGEAANYLYVPGFLPVSLRASPTITALTSSNSNVGAITLLPISNGVAASCSVTGTGGWIVNTTFSADAEL